MQKFIASILAVIMAFFGAIFPGIAPSADSYTVGEFLTAVATDFGIPAANATEPLVNGVDETDTYFAAVQAIAEWNDSLADFDTLDTSASVTANFAAVVLVNVAAIAQDVKVGATAEKVAVAIANKILGEGDFSKIFKNKALSRTVCEKAIEAAVKIANNKDQGAEEYSLKTAAGVVDLTDVTDYTVDGNKVVLPADVGLKAGDVYVLPQAEGNLAGAAFEVKSATVEGDKLVTTNASVELEDVVEKVSYKGSSTPDLLRAKVTDGLGNVVSEGVPGDAELSAIDWKALLKKVANVSFSIGGVKIKAKLTNTGFDVSAGGNIVDGVRFTKSYSVTNFNIDAKVDANLKKLQIQEAYLNMDYDLVEKTTLEGSAAASLAPTDLGEDADPVSFLERVKGNLFELKKGSGSKIDVLNLVIPLGSTPLTIDMTISLVFDIYGKAEIVITSSEVKGYEIINNKGRYIQDSVVHEKHYELAGSCSVAIGFNVGLGLFGYDIVDVGITAGLGVAVNTTIYTYNNQGAVTGVTEIEIPIDLAVESVAGLNKANQITLCADADVYGILKISVGENSILSKIGLKKTWTIFDRGNATFAHLHIEETGVIAECSRIAA